MVDDSGNLILWIIGGLIAFALIALTLKQSRSSSVSEHRHIRLR